MRNTLRWIFSALVISLLMGAPVLAHHSFGAEFDGDKTVTLTGVLNKVEWINPHVHLYISGKDENGQEGVWDIETWPTGLLHKAGLNRQMFVEGQTLTIFGYRAKDGAKYAYMGKVTFPDGHQFTLWSAGRVDPSAPSQNNQ